MVRFFIELRGIDTVTLRPCYEMSRNNHTYTHAYINFCFRLYNSHHTLNLKFALDSLSKVSLKFYVFAYLNVWCKTKKSPSNFFIFFYLPSTGFFFFFTHSKYFSHKTALKFRILEKKKKGQPNHLSGRDSLHPTPATSPPSWCWIRQWLKDPIKNRNPKLKLEFWMWAKFVHPFHWPQYV